MPEGVLLLHPLLLLPIYVVAYALIKVQALRVDFLMHDSPIWACVVASI